MNGFQLPNFEGITNAINMIHSYLNDLQITYYEAIQNTISAFINRFAEIAKSIDEWTKPKCVLERLGEHQYVYWNYLDDEFIDLILESENVNSTLRKMYVKSNFTEVNEIALKCMESQYAKPYKKLFMQSIKAFKEGNCELSVLGLISIADGLLSDVSHNSTTSVFKRADAILNKMEDNEAIDNDDYAILALIMTFRDTMESFSANAPFDKKEPKNLNRHWIMHGRSRRRKTKLDCIKMIRFIYGIILIDELSRKEEEEVEQVDGKQN